MSLRFERAMAEYRECREAYEDALYSMHNAAEEATRGALLNERGRRAGVSEVSLFMGPRARAYAYASDELREWWRSHPRMTFADFEAQWPYPEEAA